MHAYVFLFIINYGKRWLFYRNLLIFIAGIFFFQFVSIFMHPCMFDTSWLLGQMHGAFIFCLETLNATHVLPSAGRRSAAFSAIKIHKKMESFICKTNNAEEIKHSGELSGPFKNQYKAFHLRPNLFLVIILHILCSLPCLLTHKLITYRTLSHKQILRHNLRGLLRTSTFITHNHGV